MGSAWSLIQSTDSCLSTTCSSPVTSDDAGGRLAGIGTFILFTVSVSITLIASTFNIWRQYYDSKRLKAGRNLSERLRRQISQDAIRMNTLTAALILNFSDQQLIAGLATAATTRWSYSCDMTAYHYDLVCYMLLCSVATHLASLLAIDKYFYPFASAKKAVGFEVILLLFRCTGIALTIILTGLVLFNRNQRTFPVEVPADGAQNLLMYPAKCFFLGADLQDAFNGIDDSFKGFFAKNWSHGLLQYVFFIICIVITIPVAIIHSFERGCTRKLAHPSIILWPRIVVLGVVITVTAWTLTLAYLLRDWGIHEDGILDENVWTFSQILAVCLLLYSPIAFLNAASDKYDARQQQQQYLTPQQLVSAGESGYSLVSSQKP